MDSVETVIAQIQGLSGSVGDIIHLNAVLNQADETLQSQSQRLGPFLEQLDPSKHCLGYLYVL